DGQLDVELVVVPTSQLQPRLEALGQVAATLAGIDAAGPGGRPMGVNLLPPAQRHRVRDPWARVNAILLLAALLALAAAAAQLLDHRRAAADAPDAELAARAPAGRSESEGLRPAQPPLDGH